MNEEKDKKKDRQIDSPLEQTLVKINQIIDKHDLKTNIIMVVLGKIWSRNY